MAIHAYVGKPGSGKTSSVVERVVITSLKQGRHVVTNIPLFVDDLLSDFGGTIELLPHDWWERPDLTEFVKNGCVLILDELWRRWPSGQTVQKANINDKSLLAEHRHMVDNKGNSMRVVLVTQDLSQLASWARTLIETTFLITKKSKKFYRIDAYSGVVTGDKPPKSKLIRQIAGKYNSTVFSYYKSATKSQTGDVGDESVADNSGSIFRSYGLWAAVISFVLFIGLGIYGVKSFLSPGSPGVVEPKPNHAASSPKKPSKPLEPPISTAWRLVGFVHPSRPNDSSKSIANAFALIADNNGNTRYISFTHCRYFPDFTEAFCVVDGYKITNWSLKKPLPVVGGLMGRGV